MSAGAAPGDEGGVGVSCVAILVAKLTRGELMMAALSSPALCWSGWGDARTHNRPEAGLLGPSLIPSAGEGEGVARMGEKVKECSAAPPLAPRSNLQPRPAPCSKVKPWKAAILNLFFFCHESKSRIWLGQFSCSFGSETELHLLKMVKPHPRFGPPIRYFVKFGEFKFVRGGSEGGPSTATLCKMRGLQARLEEGLIYADNA